MSSKTDIFDQIEVEAKPDVFDRVAPEISKTRSVLSAPLKGAIKGAEELSGLADPVKMILSQFLPQQESLTNRVVERVLPTRDETAERLLERGGKLLPTAALGGGGVLSALLQAAGGSALGELAREEGVGETGQGVAEAVGMGIPGIAKAVAQKALSLAKAPIERFTSGLAKPRAVGAKFAEKGVISPERQQKAIGKLNEEASTLAKASVEKKLPLVKQIEQGVDFESQFEKRFGQLQKQAEHANPEIDLTPVSKFFSETAEKYRGIPKLHTEAAKIKSEIKAFNNRPQTEMKNLMRIYRSNNKKLKGIYEKSRTEGKQEEFVDFLVDYNRAIGQSFEKTLPADSAWLAEFRASNADYKQWKDSLKTLAALKPVLGGNPTPALLSKFADDPKAIKKLELSMGKQGASEISQIAKDLRTAQEAIKRIPAREMSAWDKILPLSIFVPHSGGIGAAISAKKSVDWLRKGYGWLLSTPQRRVAYRDALKAINEGNQAAYIKAAEELQKLSQESED